MVCLTNLFIPHFLLLFISLSIEELVGWKVQINAADTGDEKFFHACSGGEVALVEEMLSTTPCK